MKKRIILALAILLTGLQVWAQGDKAHVEEIVTKSNIQGHIYFLASDELRGRATGSPEIDIAAQYISSSFTRYGVKPVPGADEGYFQYVHLQSVSKPAHVSAGLNGENMEPEDMLVLRGESVTSEAEMVYLKLGTEEDFRKYKKDLTGKIVIVDGGLPEGATGSVFTAGTEKADRALERGAAGIIELWGTEAFNWAGIRQYVESERYRVAPKPSADQSFFQLWVKDYEGAYMDVINKAKKQKMMVSLGARNRKDMYSKNVVGMVEGTDPVLKNEFIIYSAHYDHVGIGKANDEGDSIYNGARDNAVGVVTVMSAAESIAKKPTKRSALFILFTGEEMGLLGSSYYVENPLLPLNQMVYCFNSDNGGYNDTSVATIIGLDRTTEAEHIRKACEMFGLTAIDDPAKEQGLFDRSDNVNFAREGIPAPTFSMGFQAFDEEIFKYYHQTRDNPDNLDYDYLEKFFRAYVMACRLIADDTGKPFWVEGDKYYDAGKALYNPQN
ncbi:M28 family peptidase [Fulvivirga sedimenti]|uniref:M28 family peptidase n=1 Tax=Fulvivirga sedimenti TaxID=2879465 RepID=A0A9X1HNI5_9BACT|nr:M28 family peptidase [Fulvivirga sedimenti]MCA6073454.1 M28 family peptidase [Fulvivirga sedimenti]